MPSNQDFSLNLQGLQQVKQALSQLPLDVNEKVVKDLNKKAASIAAKILKEATPDSSTSTRKAKNKLSNAVKIVATKSKTGAAVGFSKKKGYPILWIQGGTKQRQTQGKGQYRKGANRGKISAKPFVQQAFDKAVPEVLEFMKENYIKLINQSLKKYLSKLKS